MLNQDTIREATRLTQKVQDFFLELRTGPLDRRAADNVGYRGPERRAERNAKAA